MFNITKVYNTTNHPKTLEVKEYRAPTDESVKILKQLEQEAMNKIVAMGKIEDNIFNVKWYITNDCMTWEDRCRCVFTMNGEKYDFEFLLPGKFDVSSSTEYCEYMKSKLLEKLTTIFLDDLMQKCMKQLLKSLQIKNDLK